MIVQREWLRKSFSFLTLSILSLSSCIQPISLITEENISLRGKYLLLSWLLGVWQICTAGSRGTRVEDWGGFVSTIDRSFAELTPGQRQRARFSVSNGHFLRSNDALWTLFGDFSYSEAENRFGHLIRTRESDDKRNGENDIILPRRFCLIVSLFDKIIL